LAQTTPAFLKALGRNEPPAEVALHGHRYLRRLVYKHDFFAATALYECETHRAIVKFGRAAPVAFLPLSWVGRLLTAREAAALNRLAGLDGIPKVLGRLSPTALGREYIEGEPLRRGGHVPDDFHSRLLALIQEVHRRDMAYVDLEKPENVLLGKDGKPYLFDFQIAWLWPRRFGGDLWPMRVVRRWFQNGDLYHLTKLKRRTRPDQLTQEEQEAGAHKPWFVRVHSAYATPLRRLRRWILGRIDPRRVSGERGRVAGSDTGGL